MSEDQLVQSAEIGEQDVHDTDRWPGMLDVVSKVPFGMQAAVLAGALVVGAGIAGMIGESTIPGTTCCPPLPH
ncbi:hypothetical protein [Micromonospora sp. NPDC049282]|uniref:hypothetical protein n=1 Tax=Micromonospora sp. NPDC049282 TaxID=3364269 RepID=UPI00371BF68F